MGIGSGIGASIGVSTESVYGTYVAPARSIEFLSETLDFDRVIAQGTGLRGGSLFERGARRYIAEVGGKGDVQFELPSKGLGVWLKAAAGASTITQQGATAAWLQVHTPGDLLGQSLTIQKGVPNTAGTVTPYSFTGCKVTDFEIDAKLGGIVTGKWTVDAQNVTTSQSLAALAYPSSINLFHFAEGALMVGGSPTFSTTALSTGGTAVAQVKDFTFTAGNNLNVKRQYIGGAGVKAEPLFAGFRNAKIKLTADFVDTTFPVAYLADTGVSIVLTFTGPVIASTFHEVLQIAIPLAKPNGQVPQVANGDVVPVSLDLDVLDDGTNAQWYIGYQSADTAY